MQLAEHGLADQPEPMAGQELERKINNRSAQVGVIGLGYVGLPLAVEIAQAGFQVTGIDIGRARVDAVNSGISYILDVPSETLAPLVQKKSLRATQSLAAIEKLDSLSICVPTPLRKTKDPDLSYVVAAVEAVNNHLKSNQLIILESTTYPGTSREVVLPILEKSGLRVGKDFFLAYSPERVDPGNRTYTTRNIPKVIGGITPRCMELSALLYGQFIQEIVPVSSAEAAEMVKLFENSFRSVNIALANEMALTCRKLGINVWEVIEAAKTKPFGFMPFFPGPGLGGHCLPVDPYYLTWKAKMNGFEPRLIELASLINSQMPGFTISRIADALNERKKSLKGSTILAIGVAYKRNANDIRESPALEVIRGLYEKGAQVSYSDPYVASINLNGETVKSTPVNPQVLERVDCVVVLTDHSVFDYQMIATHSNLVLDCRNALGNVCSDNVVCL
jgi:UDP-N-acetyl-D-glucosamine dehydrogenase